MGIAEEAFKGLWPERDFLYDASVKYSGKFKGFNANVKLAGSRMSFSLSRNWKDVSKDIKMGLLQELMARILRERGIRTPNIDLYHIFLKKVHIAVPKTRKDSFLEGAFNRVNSMFFSGMMETPNLVWNNSSRKLGSYDYGSDTITISKMLMNADTELVDYVMYHEMLHKKYKFNSKGGRTLHHTREFRSSESAFPNSALIEKRLRCLRPSASMMINKPRRRFRLFGFI